VAARPNIIVIMTDDQTVADLRAMPNVLKLFAGEGTTFDDNVVSYSLCCPSRATFLPGQYSHNTGVTGNAVATGITQFKDENTLAVWLQKAGYSTVMIGKYLNEYLRVEPKAVPPGWETWYGGLRFAYYNWTLNHNGKEVSYGSTTDAYQTDVFTRLAIREVRAHSRRGPFFMWLSYWAPHYGGPSEDGDPTDLHVAVPAERHEGRFATEPLPLPPSFDEADVSDKPRLIQGRPRLTPDKINSLTIAYRKRLESLLAVDEGVAALVNVLKEQRVYKNTVLLFTSDNGYLLGEHRIVNDKVALYEPSIRVPLLMRGPGVPAGLHLTQQTANIDLAPTIAALAGAKPKLKEDGRSLLPLLAAPSLPFRRDILLERGKDANGVRIYTAIRTERYVYAEYDTGERELYDLLLDPDELVSKHADPAYAAIEAELARRLALLRDCAGVTCRYAAPAFP
jgi:N-acetylglucosamine-6-sulfatase